MLSRLERAAVAMGRLAQAFTAPTRARIRNDAAYESTGSGRRTLGWRTSTIGPNASTLPHLRRLREQARDRYRNDPYGGGAIDYRTAQLVGCGIWPKSRASDKELRARVDALFARWAPECDADGRCDFAGLQTLVTRTWQEAGEVFTRFRNRRPEDGLSVPLQLQILEPELLPLDDERILPTGNTVRAGIERNGIGQRQAYYFHPAHPGDGDTRIDLGQLVRIRADEVAHVYLPLRAGQLRGLPHLFRTLLALRDLDLGEDATLQRWMLGNMFMGWLKKTPMADPALDPLTGQPIQRDASDQAIIAMEPGAMPVLQYGEELEFNEPPEAGQSFEAFMRHVLRKVAIATGTPYHALTGDMAQVNDRTIRVILQDFRRSLEALQEQVLVHQFCQPVFTAWFERAVLSGALELSADVFADPERLADAMAVEWSTHRWNYINPVQDVEADRAEVRAGFASRSQKIQERGYDGEVIDEQRAEDNARERRLGIDSDSNAATTDGTGKRLSDPAPQEEGVPA
jgi:lambda family phage portal protein